MTHLTLQGGLPQGLRADLRHPPPLHPTPPRQAWASRIRLTINSTVVLAPISPLERLLLIIYVKGPASSVGTSYTRPFICRRRNENATICIKDLCPSRAHTYLMPGCWRYVKIIFSPWRQAQKWLNIMTQSCKGKANSKRIVSKIDIFKT